MPQHIPELEADTREFFQIISERSDTFQTYSSSIVQTELVKAPLKKKTLFLTLLNSINNIELAENDDVESLVVKYLQAGFLTKNHIDDITHIAYAVIAQCDYVVSWNMRHIVREKTISGVHAVNRYNNYSTPSIVTPGFFIEENTNENGH